jgi:hypothetical protein
MTSNFGFFADMQNGFQETREHEHTSSAGGFYPIEPGIRKCPADSNLPDARSEACDARFAVETA